jgi:IS1 family transposase
MNCLSATVKAQVIAALVEGSGINATCRMTNTSKPAVLKLLADLGRACYDYHDKHVRGIRSKRIQCDELWSFVGAKQKNVTEEQMAGGWGDCWTWTALDADSKLMVSYLVGQRGAWWANQFLKDVASRVSNRVQLTTDGYTVYVNAVENAFGAEVDYAMLIKLYGNQGGPEARYSPGEVIGTETVQVMGNPDPAHISTSYVERQNLTVRMSIRRFTRLTNAFSKKLANHEAAIALHYMHYNYVRIHKTLRITPAMAAGLTDHVWTVDELVALLPVEQPKKRGPYKKRG